MMRGANESLLRQWPGWRGLWCSAGQEAPMASMSGAGDHGQYERSTMVTMGAAVTM